MLASAFTLLPFVGFVLAGNPEGFRLIALPGGLALGVVPLLLHFGLPESPRWHLSRGNPKAAVDAVNSMIARSGGRIPPLTIAALGTGRETAREALPPIKALFGPGQLRWTLIGTACFAVGTTAYYCSAILLPKALIDQDQQRLVEMARQDLQQRGVPNAADAPIPAEMFAEQAERRVKLGLVLAELVKTNDLQAKPEQIRAEVDEFAKSYEDPKEVVRWYYSNQQRLAEMEAYVVESNVVDFVLGKARVSDKEVSFEELASATAQA
jgi:hypothetical protein